MKPEPVLALVWDAIAPFRSRALVVILLVLSDTTLASVGIGLILPVLQTVMTPERQTDVLSQWVPAFQNLGPDTRVLWLGGGLIAVFCIKAMVSLLTVGMSRSFTELLRLHWQTRIGEHFLYGTYRSLQTEKQGVLLNNWFNESASAARFFVSYLGYLSALTLALALIGLGLYVNWQAMAAFLVFGVVVVYVLKNRVFGAMARLGQQKLRLSQAINAAMAESLLNARDLKLLGAEPNRLSQIEIRARDLKSVFVRIAVMSDAPRIAGEFLAVTALMMLLIGGVVFLGQEPQAFLPVLAFFLVAFYRLMTASSQAFTARARALSDLHSLRLVYRLSEDTTQRESRVGGSSIRTIDTDIRLENVSFAYEAGRPIICNVELAIPRGCVTFLVGPSGAGKSSLVDLLLRLHLPTSGRIVANGQNIEEFNLIQWRQCFGYVSQEVALFNGSIRMNLLLAKPNATEAEMIEACRLAGAHEFICDFPNGYETAVGDRGHSLSGGQRKRVGIARAILMRPAVLILDEATTSFEQTLERVLIEEMKRKQPDLTVIQITHRLQTVDKADFVAVLDQGRVVASGSGEIVRRQNLSFF